MSKVTWDINLGGRACALGSAAVQHVCNVIHVRNAARLRPVNCGRTQSGFKRSHIGVGRATCSDDPAQTLFGDLERGLAGEGSGNYGECGGVKALVALFMQPAFRQQGGAARQAAGALA